MSHPDYGRLRPVTPFAAVLLAENPGPMTLEGTNTWLLGTGTGRVVVDPGPDDAEHLRRVAGQAPVELVLLTHHHADHTGGVAAFAERTGAAVRALDPALCVRGEPLRDGEVVEAAGVRITALATPGHTKDSTSFLVEHDGSSAVLTGDTILGRGTTVVAQPDGHLGSYLATLERLARFPAGTPALPGHGPELPDLAQTARAYQRHRAERLDQVRAVVRERGPRVTACEVVKVVYADVDPSVWPAAEWTVAAQLTYLAEQGEL